MYKIVDKPILFYIRIRCFGGPRRDHLLQNPVVIASSLEVLDEPPDILGILNGEGRIVPGQLQASPHAGHVLLGAATASETGSQVDNSSRLGKETIVGGYPEGTTEVDFSEIIGC